MQTFNYYSSARMPAVELLRLCDGLSHEDIVDACQRHVRLEQLMNTAQQRIAVALWHFTPHAAYEDVHKREGEFLSWMLGEHLQRFYDIQEAIRTYQEERSAYVRTLLSRCPAS